jgi:hypothetical protein
MRVGEAQPANLAVNRLSIAWATARGDQSVWAAVRAADGGFKRSLMCTG